MDTLGKRIRFIRARLDLNQTDFAKELGLESAVAISKYESGQREPDMNKLINISNMGKVSLDWLLTGEDVQKFERKEEMPGHESDSKLAGLMDKLMHIFKEGSLKERAEVRGIIEEVYDEINKSRK